LAISGLTREQHYPHESEAEAPANFCQNWKVNQTIPLTFRFLTTPPCQSKAIMSKVSSRDKELFSVPGGHIGIMAGSGANKRTWPKIDSWLGQRSR
jgi:hypothetical protein